MPSTVLHPPRDVRGDAPPAAVSEPTPARRRRWPVPRATFVLAAVVVVASLVALRDGPFLGDGAFDLRELLLGSVTVTDPVQLPLIVAAILVVGAASERVLGARRLLLAYVGGGLVTSVVGLLVGAVETAFLPAVPLNSEPFTGAPPVAALLVVAMTASSFFGALWRRRVRLASFFLAVVLFLYSASASDLFALLALPIGLVTGMLLGGRRATLRVQRSSHHEKRVLLAALTAATAIGPVIATLWGSGAGLLSIYGWLSYDPLTLADGQVCVVGSSTAPCPDVATFTQLQMHAGWIAALPLVVLLVASWGILRGRRGALGIAVGVNLLIFAGMGYVFAVTEPETLSALASVRDADEVTFVWQSLVGMVIGAVVPLAVAVTLFVFRRAVRVPSAPGARMSFVVTIAIAGSATLSAALVGVLTFSDQFRPWPGVDLVMRTLPLRLLPPSLLPAESVVFVPVTGWAQAVWYLPAAVFWSVCVVASVRLIVSGRTSARAGDRVRAREVLERGGGGSLAFMTTWSGNAYWFSPDVDAAIAYRVQGRIAVTLGGAFGADRHDPRVARAFVDFCGENGWTAVFYSVDERERASLESLGWRQTQVAEEAVIDPQTWTPAGKKRQDVRTATNRAQREGVRAQWTSWAELAFLDRAQIREISEAWVADKSIPEMEFTLGGIDQVTDPAVRLMLARDDAGRIVAVTSWIPIAPEGAVRGYALDVMRRRHDAMNGIMEFVIGAVVEQLRADGMTMMSLSGSPLAHHRDAGDPDAVERFLEQLSTLLEPAYGFRSLANFKKKFQPEFAAMWMVYPDPTQLPAVGLALMRCYVPGLTLARAARIAAGLRASAREARTEQPAVPS